MKTPNTKNYFFQPIAQMVFIPMSVAIELLALKVGYFAHMNLKQKKKIFLMKSKLQSC